MSNLEKKMSCLNEEILEKERDLRMIKSQIEEDRQKLIRKYDLKAYTNKLEKLLAENREILLSLHGREISYKKSHLLGLADILQSHVDACLSLARSLE